VYETGPLNLWRTLPKLQPPVLVVRGADSDTLGEAAVRALRQRLPQAQVVDVAGAGHLVPLEKPEAVGKLVRVFLENL
jgi:pimeloyl-ACP methyl ester carboxylesterase